MRATLFCLNESQKQSDARWRHLQVVEVSFATYLGQQHHIVFLPQPRLVLLARVNSIAILTSSAGNFFLRLETVCTLVTSIVAIAVTKSKMFTTLSHNFIWSWAEKMYAFWYVLENLLVFCGTKIA